MLIWLSLGLAMAGEPTFAERVDRLGLSWHPPAQWTPADVILNDQMSQDLALISPDGHFEIRVASTNHSAALEMIAQTKIDPNAIGVTDPKVLFDAATSPAPDVAATP